MGKPTGFLEYTRENFAEKAPQERIGNWQEFKCPVPEENLRTQAARCMECGIPFCHSGLALKGVAMGCPLNNLIPEWNDLIYRGYWREAFLRLLYTNNFPEFTGRVCPAPCEGSCTLGSIDDPVNIKSIESAIIEKAFDQGWVTANPPQTRTGQRVAVVGSGPSGLACADQLNQQGHLVTIFEKADRIGGLLMYGIPNMKLDKRQVVERRVALLQEEGITFVTNCRVGEDISGVELKKEFDAVVLCCGAEQPRDLPVPGRGLGGIHFALEFLRANTRHLLSGQQGDPPLSARDKDVVIIGGGDTGTDCVATAVRQGCRSVVQLEIMPQPPTSRQPDNPWPEWPRVLRTDYGQIEAKAKFGQDPRCFSVMTKSFEGQGTGWVQKVRTVQVVWQKNAEGRFSPQEVPGSVKDFPAQLVLLAMGFKGADPALPAQLGVNLDGTKGFRTNVPGVFMAGDMRRGQSLVVWAIKEGRDAAALVNQHLQNPN